MRARERRGREMFVPLAHAPGHAQADFGEAVVVIGGVEQKAHFFVMDLPHSDACFVRAYPAATAEAWVDGHVQAFTFFGKVPTSVLYDNDRCLVAKILPDGTRKRATLFSGFLSHSPLIDCCAINFRAADAVKHLVLCQVERRPPKLDLYVYPYLPRADVGTTSAARYMSLLSEDAA